SSLAGIERRPLVPSASEALAFAHFPLRDALVVTGQEHLRHVVPPVAWRSRITWRAQHSLLAERTAAGTVEIGHCAGQQSDRRIHEGESSRLAATQHEV